MLAQLDRESSATYRRGIVEFVCDPGQNLTASRPASYGERRPWPSVSPCTRPEEASPPS